MMWLWISLLVWLALSPIVAVLVGRAVRIAEERRTRWARGTRLADPAEVA